MLGRRLPTRGALSALVDPRQEGVERCYTRYTGQDGETASDSGEHVMKLKKEWNDMAKTLDPESKA